METDLIKIFLPEGILEYFEVTSVSQTQDSFTIKLEEKNIAPGEYSDKKLLSKGFLEEVTIRDFPIRGKASYLKVKRRRWTVQQTGDIVLRDWDLVAKGTRMTQEFATFLKELHRRNTGKL